ALNGAFPLRVDIQRVGERADEMKITRRFAGRKDELDGRRIVSAPLVQLLQTLETMTRARMLVAYARQLRLGVADCFVSANHGVNRCFAFGLKICDSRASVAQFTRQALGFEFSFRVLARGTIAFAREAFSLLR